MDRRIPTFSRGELPHYAVECSPPYDSAEITSLMGVRVIADVLGTLVNHGHLTSTEGE